LRLDRVIGAFILKSVTQNFKIMTSCMKMPSADFEDMRKELAAHGQEHVLKFWPRLTNEQKALLAADVQAIDLNDLVAAYRDTVTNKENNQKLDELLEPIPDELHEGVSRCTPKQLQEYQNIETATIMINQSKIHQHVLLILILCSMLFCGQRDSWSNKLHYHCISLPFFKAYCYIDILPSSGYESSVINLAFREPDSPCIFPFKIASCIFQLCRDHRTITFVPLYRASHFCFSCQISISHALFVVGLFAELDDKNFLAFPIQGSLYFLEKMPGIRK
ncbi:UDP-N-acetylhexosamine pyrophosphorylase, partial [Caerostris extrusa]